MQAITAVRNVRNPEVLAGGQKIFNTLWNQRAERDLKGQGGDVNVVVTSSAGV